MRAVRQIVDDFEGLSLHDRWPSFVLTALSSRTCVRPWRRDGIGVLDPALHAGDGGRSRRGMWSERRPDEDGTPEWLIVDEIEQMDGLERLICLCAGLDAIIDDQDSDTLETRRCCTGR